MFSVNYLKNWLLTLWIWWNLPNR